MMGKILVPIDGSPNSIRGLEKAIEFARKAQKFIQDVEDRCTNQNIAFTTRIIYGYDPAYDIEQFTEKYKHDMIVIGAKGKSVLKRLFLGSVSRYIVQTSKIPVTVVK